MALVIGIPNESEKLIQQLEGLRFIVDINRNVLNANPVLKEFLAFKMDMAQSLIDELQSWEALRNKSKCNQASDNALFFIEQIQVLLDRVLDARCEEAWLNSQRELKFNSYAPPAYEYVLMDGVKACSKSVAG